MRNRTKLILAGAVAFATPAVSHAAVINLAYDPSNIKFSIDGGSTFNTANFNSGTDTITVPANAIIEIGMTGDITGNTNTGSGVGYDTTASPKAPTTLGLGSFGLGYTRNASTAAAFNPGNVAFTTKNAVYTSGGGGTSDGSGGVTGVSGGYTAGSFPFGSPNYANTQFANGTLTSLFTGLEIDAGASAGTSVFTPSTAAASFSKWANKSIGTSTGTTNSGTKPVYGFNALASDTISGPGVLTVQVTGGSTGHNIISLTPASGGAPVSNYGVTLTNGAGANQATFNPNAPTQNAINVVGGNGGYVPGFANSIQGASGPGSATDNVKSAGFTSGDLEVYALKFAGTVSQTQDQTVVNDINAETGTGVTASLVSGNYASEFPGYNVLLQGSPADTGAFLGFDFSQETNVPGLSVTDIAAVPEPATAAGVLIGAAGLLLGRRKRAITKA